MSRGRSGAGGSGQSRRQGPSSKRTAARENRRLRHLVARLRGCLHTLKDGARRLLALRAGLDGPARSAGATARILHLSKRREGRLERRALRLLQRSAATGCAGVVAPLAAGQSPAGQSATGQMPVTGLLAPGARSAPSTGGASGGSAVTFGASSSRGGRAGRGARHRNAGQEPPGGSVERAAAASSFPGAVLISALLALLLGLALIALRESRRRLHPAGASPAGPAPRAEQTPAPTPPARRLPPPRRSWTKMDEAMTAMAADVFAAMSGESDQPHPGAEAEGSDPQAQVEDQPKPEPGDQADG